MIKKEIERWDKISGDHFKVVMKNEDATLYLSSLAEVWKQKEMHVTKREMYITDPSYEHSSYYQKGRWIKLLSSELTFVFTTIMWHCNIECQAATFESI